MFLSNELLYFLDGHPNIQNFSQMKGDWEKDARLLCESEHYKPKKNFKESIENIAKNWLQEEKDILLQLEKKFKKKISFNKSKYLEDRVNQIIENIEENNYLHTCYYTLLGKNGISLFQETRHKDKLYFDHILYLKSKRQVIETEIFSIKKNRLESQLKYLVNILKEEGAREQCKICIYKSKNKFITETLLSKLVKNIDYNDPFDGLNIDPTMIKDKFFFKVTMEQDLPNFYKSKKIIKDIETHMEIFFSQFIDPFSI